MGAFPSARSSTGSALMRALLLILPLMSVGLLVSDISGQQRPGKHPAFSEGFRALRQEDWETVADRMLKALAAWPEDGELTRVYGRLFEPYLPRYYLGMALHDLGCYEQSLKQLNESILNKKEVKGAKKQLEELESLKLKTERFVRQGLNQSEGADCERWKVRKPRQFIRGIKALDLKDWEEAARLMLEAQQIVEEDGEMIYISGSRWEPYLPYFYRGKAFLGLGKCDEALKEWKKSETKGAITGKRTEEEFEEMQELRARCENKSQSFQSINNN